MPAPDPDPAAGSLPGDAGKERAGAGTATPAWLEVLAVGAALLLAAVGSVGLLLAINERYTTWAALGGGVPIAVAATVSFARHRRADRSPASARYAAAAALVVAVAFGAFFAATPSQNVVVSRDPGSYATTARWLVRDGKLSADARGDAFDGVGGLQFAGAAVYDVGGTYEPAGAGDEAGGQSGRIEYQFNHLTSVALATAYDLGGPRLMFRLPAIASATSLLLVYAVAVRLTRRPVVALLAPLLLGASTPFLYVGRNTYSESFASVLLWAAILVAVDLHRRPHLAGGLVTGLLLGALVSTRVDALLYVALLFPLAAISVAATAPRAVRVRRVATWLAAFGVTGAVGYIGWVDLNEQSGWYAEHLTPQLDLLRKGLLVAAAASVVGALAWLTITPIRRLAERIRRPMAALAAAAVGVLLLFGWIVRPEVQTATTDLILPTVENLQRRHGLPIEPDRSYAEHSLRWMSWYLGVPAVALAIGALVAATWQALARRVEPVTVGLLALCLGAGGLYWYDPEITPDHLWATRRFVPATFPVLAIWAAAAVAMLASVPLVERARRRLPAAASVAVVAVLAVVVLAPPALTTKPVRWQRIQAGYLRPILDTCEALPDDAAVLLVGTFAGTTLTTSIRAWCGVPAAWGEANLEPARLAAVAERVEANGYRLHLVSPDLGALEARRDPAGPPPVSSSGSRDLWMAEQTLDRAPNRYLPEGTLPVPSPFALHLLDVSPAARRGPGPDDTGT